MFIERSTETSTEAPTKRLSQEERRRRSERALLDAAAEVFAEKGFTNASLEEIGVRAGYSRALASHKFGSKEGVVRALIDQITSDVYVSAVPLNDSDLRPLDLVQAIADGYVAGLGGYKPRVRALYVLMTESLGALRDLNPIFVELTETFIGEFKTLLQQAVKEGALADDTDVDSVAVGIVAHLRGITLMWLTAPKLLDIEKARKELSTSLKMRLSL